MLIIALFAIGTIAVFGKIQCEKLRQQYEQIQAHRYEVPA